MTTKWYPPYLKLFRCRHSLEIIVFLASILIMADVVSPQAIVVEPNRSFLLWSRLCYI